jgi:predicted Zn-dependent protease
MIRRIFFSILFLCGFLSLEAQVAYKPMVYTTSGASLKQDAYIKRLSPAYISPDKKYVSDWNDYLYRIYEAYGKASKESQFIKEPYVTRYLQQVLKTILDSNKIKQKIEIVCTRYAEANAYNMGDNRLYVNIGVLQLLQNEAQLAFLLSHELSHQLLQHVQEKFRDNRTLAADRSVQKEIKDIRRAKYNKLDRSAQFSIRYQYLFANYSRAKERAADSMAIVLLRNTRYNILEGASLLELLKESETDQAQIDYNRYFATQGEPLKKEWLQNSVSSISFGHKRAVSFEEDSVKTHPDIPARQEAIRWQAQTGTEGNRENFIVSSGAFDSIKAASRYEIIESYATNKRYAATLYAALRQLEAHPDEPYLIRHAAVAFKNAVTAVKSHTIQDHVPVEAETNGVAYNQLLRHFDRPSLTELTRMYNRFVEHYSAQLTSYPEIKKLDD